MICMHYIRLQHDYCCTSVEGRRGVGRGYRGGIGKFLFPSICYDLSVHPIHPSIHRMVDYHSCGTARTNSCLCVPFSCVNNTNAKKMAPSKAVPSPPTSQNHPPKTRKGTQAVVVTIKSAASLPPCLPVRVTCLPPIHVVNF